MTKRRIFVAALIVLGVVSFWSGVRLTFASPAEPKGYVAGPSALTPSPEPATYTPVPTDTPVVPTDTPAPTNTPVVPTATPVPTNAPPIPTQTPGGVTPTQAAATPEVRTAKATPQVLLPVTGGDLSETEAAGLLLAGAGCALVVSGLAVALVTRRSH